MRKDYITGGIVGIIMGVIAALLPFPLSAPLLDVLSSLIYSDLYRECGTWCYQTTSAGWLIVVLCFIVIGILAGFATTFIKKELRLIVRIAVVFASAILITGILTVSIGGLEDYLPHMPTKIRCAPVIHNEEKFGSFPFGPDAGRISCAYQLAMKEEDPKWCERIENSITQSRCVGLIADQINNLELCDKYTGLDKSICLDQTVDENAPDVQLSALTTLGTQKGKNNYFDADIPTQPTELWNKNFGFTEPTILIVDDFLIGSYEEDHCSDLGAYKDGTVVWTMRGKLEGYCSKIDDPAVDGNIIIYHDYDKIYAYGVSGKLWEKSYAYGGNIIVDGNTYYAEHDTQGSTGHPIKIMAGDTKTGKQKWDTVIGTGNYHSAIILTPNNIIATQRSAFAPLKAYIYIINRMTGSAQEIVYPLISEKNFVGIPVATGGKVFVRTGDGILVIDEATGELSIREEPLDLNQQAIWDSHSKNIATDGTLLYYTTDEKTLKATTLEGTPVWTKQLEPLASPIIVTNKQVITTTEKSVVALNKQTGEELWMYPILIPISGQLYASGNNLFYFNSDSRLIALG